MDVVALPHSHPKARADADTKAKDNTQVHSLSASAPANGDQNLPRRPTGGAPWSRPAFYTRLPWEALLALILALLFAGSMIAVVVLSHHSRVASWEYYKVTPNVCLSIVSICIGVLLRFAFSRAVVIAWWVSASREQTTVAELHHTWSYATSLKDALLAGRSFNFVALATVALAILPASGPLAQRSSSVTTRVVQSPVSLTIPAQRELTLETGSTGYFNSRSGYMGFTTASFGEVVQEYLYNISATTNSRECQGVCYGVVEAAGFDMKCTEERIPIGLDRGTDGQSSQAIGGNDVFGTSFSYNETVYDDLVLDTPPQDGSASFPAPHSQFNYTAVFKTAGDCVSALTRRHCTLAPAIMAYPVIVSNGTIALNPDHNYLTDKVVRPTPALSNTWIGNSSHGGIYLATNSLLSSTVNLRWNGRWELAPFGSSWLKYSVPITPGDPSGTQVVEECPNRFVDPTDDMLATVRELAFRMALRSAEDNTSAVQTVQATDLVTELVYESSALYLIIAVVFIVLGIVCVVPLMVGWWRLNREVTLSPVEIARAFDAPVLAGEDANLTAQQLVEKAGHRCAQTGIGPCEHLGSSEDGASEKGRRQST